PVAGRLKPSELQVVVVVPHDAAKARLIWLLVIVDLDVRAFAPELAIAAHPAEDVVPIGSSLEVRRRRFREHDRSADLTQRSALGLVGGPIGSIPGRARSRLDVASVELEVVHPPRSEESRVGREMRLTAILPGTAAGVTAASRISGILIDAEFQSQGMDCRGHW